MQKTPTLDATCTSSNTGARTFGEWFMLACHSAHGVVEIPTLIVHKMFVLFFP